MREDVDAGKHAERDRPDDEAACHDHVEERLQENRGHEGRVGRSLDAALGDEQLDRIASARRDDRIDARARDIGTEQLSPPDVSVAVRSLDDVPPRPRDRYELAELTDDRDAEPLELDIGKVAEENRDRVPRRV